MCVDYRTIPDEFGEKERPFCMRYLLVVLLSVLINITKCIYITLFVSSTTLQVNIIGVCVQYSFFPVGMQQLAISIQAHQKHQKGL
jgi:hypothetical protein